MGTHSPSPIDSPTAPSRPAMTSAKVAEAPGSPALAAGDVVTTATLTDARPIGAGKRWDTRIAGLPLADIRLAF